MNRHGIGMVLLSILLLVGVALPVRGQLTADERRNARSAWLKGFESFEQGEALAKQEASVQALAYFKQALGRFEEVKRRYPRWNSALIEYRITLCRARIATVEATLAEAGVAKPQEAAEVMAASQQRSADLERQLEQAQASLEEARRELVRSAQMANEAKKLMAAKDELEQRAASLEAENRRLQLATEARPADEQTQQEMKRCLTENEELRQAKAKLAQEQLDQAQELDRVRQQLAQLKFDLEARSQEVLDRQQQCDNLAIDLQGTGTIAQDRATALTKQTELTEALRQDLARERETGEKLRDDLRELREQGDTDAASRQLQVENEQLLRDLEDIHAAMAKLEAERSQLVRDLEERTRRLGDVERVLAGVEADRKTARQDLATSIKRLAVAEVVQQRQNEIIAGWEKQEVALQEELKQVSLSLGQLQAKEKEFSELALANTKLEAKNRALAQRVEEVQTHAGRAEDDRQAAVAKQVEGNRRMAELEQQRATLEKELLVSHLKLEDLPELQKKAEQHGQMVTELADLARKQQESEQQLTAAAAELITVKDAAARAASDLEAERQELARKAQEIVDLRQAQEAAALPVAELQTQLAEVQQRVAQLQVETAQATACQTELTATVGDRDRRIAELEAQLKAPPPAIVAPVALATTASPVIPAAGPGPQLAVAQLVEVAIEAEKSGQREAAIQQYQRILELDPANLDARSRLGLIAAEAGQDEAARKYLEAALQDDPEDLEKLLALSFTYLRTGQHYLALGTLGRAAAQDPRNPDLQRYLGVACSNLGWAAAAEKQFLASFELEPKNAETAFNLAVLLATAAPERKDEARTWYKKAIELGAETDPGMDEMFK